MQSYIHQRASWPHFTFDWEQVAGALAAVRHKQGTLSGQMEVVGFPLRQEAILATLTEDVVKSSQIEGENLNRPSVRSSVARQLGIGAGLPVAERGVDGVVEMMVDATQHYDRPLTAERLFNWHAALFPNGRSGMQQIEVGCWRSDAGGPMQVISGPIGKQHVHFQAPAATRLELEIKSFLTWFNAEDRMDWVVKAALAHLWFITLHPFSDGNGRIARAIADLALARSGQSAHRFYSMSSQIQRERQDYYDHLEQAQRGNLDVTDWIGWFLACLDRAVDRAHNVFEEVLMRDRLWRHLAQLDLNARQRAVLGRLLDHFEGKLTSSKWAKLGKCSQDAAGRDLSSLEKAGVVKRNPEGGRSTSYSLDPSFGSDGKV